MSKPAPTISVPSGVAIVVGIVIGMGIFKAPSTVAGAAGSVDMALLFWALGGFISLMGALTYAELAAAYPDKGGEYALLSRAYGMRLAFVFGWARLAVIQTGTVAGAAFVLGDYLQPLFPLGPQGPTLYAAIAVIALTALNLGGLRPSTLLQSATEAVVVGSLVVLAGGAALIGGASVEAAPSTAMTWPGWAAAGFAMIFVLLTFGGWNEAAYLSGEVKRPQRDTTLILFIGVGVVTALYLAINWAYLHVLGLEGAASSDTVGASLAEAVFGPWAGLLVTAFVVAALVSTINATLLTGGRSAYALGRDFPIMAALGRWDEARGAPQTAILAQGGISLLLVGLGALTQQGFETMVAYTAPVFWAFFLLTGLSIVVLRKRDPDRPRPFRTPLYPLPPLLFCLAAAWMLWSSVSYAISLFRSAATDSIGVDGFAVGVAASGVALLVGLIGALAARPGAARPTG